MNETYTTVVGRMATAVDRREFASGNSCASFRIASNERRYNRSDDSWGAGDSLYITVRCWRQLGENVLASMRVGDPVLVHGRLFTRSFERNGRREFVIEMDAVAVGPDLRWSRADVTRTSTAAPATARADSDGAAEQVASEVGLEAGSAGDVPRQPRGAQRLAGERLTSAVAAEAAVQG
jgi:single-strand DNA-binding protein